MSKTFFTRYDRRRVQFSSEKPSLTIQSDLADTLIPNIFARCGVNLASRSAPMFGDFASMPSDLLQAHQMLDDARQRFGELPSAVRARFNNDPLQLLQFVSNSANREEAVKLGLIEAPVTELSPAATAAPAPGAGGTPNT